MTQVDDVGRPAVPLAADEAGTLLGFLEYQRATLAWKCSGLDTDGLVATVGPSTMTLGGLLKHLTRVEDIWFSQRLHGRDAEPPWDTVPWAEEWSSAAEDTPEELHALWRGAVARSRTRVAEAMADDGLDRRPRASPAPGARSRPACAGSSCT
jgi:uncharacterized damage-inducible protein DinB